MAEERSGPPLAPPDLAQAIAAMLTGRDEQTHCSANLCSKVRHRGMEITTTISRLFLGTRNSWVLSRRFFIKPMNHWKLTAGSRLLSPSSHCIHIMTMTGRHSQLSSFEVQHVRGGITT